MSYFRFRTATRPVAALLLASAFAAAARAQESEAPTTSSLDRAYDQLLDREPEAAAAPAEPIDLLPDGLDRGHDGWRYELELDASQISRAGFDQGPGNVERRTYALGARFDSDASEDAWRWRYRFENHVYRFDGASGLLPGTSGPVEAIYMHRFGVERTARLGERWRLRLDAEIDVGSESVADFGDGLTWLAVAGFSHRIHDRFDLSLDVRAQDQLEDDVSLVPVPGFEWRIDQATRLRVDARGLMLEGYLLRGPRVYLATEYENLQVRLDESGPNPGGAFSDRGLRTRLGIVFDGHVGGHSVESSRLEAFVGVAHGRELDFRAVNSDVGGADVDDSAFFGLRLTLSL